MGSGIGVPLGSGVGVRMGSGVGAGVLSNLSDLSLSLCIVSSHGGERLLCARGSANSKGSLLRHIDLVVPE
jgi:hypothetical protein